MRTQILRTFLVLLVGIKCTRLTKPHLNISDNDTDYVNNYATGLNRTNQYDDHDTRDRRRHATTLTMKNPQHSTTDKEQYQHNNNISLHITDGESASNRRELTNDSLAAELRIIHRGDDNRGNNDESAESHAVLGNGNVNRTEEEADQKVIDDAVKEGLEELHELYYVKEPLLYKMGLYIDPKEPAGRVAAFSEPNPRASLHAKYGFATVQASLKLAQRYPESLGRQNHEFGNNLRTTLLNEQCPLRGIPRCALPSKRYRTADGTCNNIGEPWKGSSMIPMQRFLPPTYEDGIQNPKQSIFNKDLPSPRKISITIHKDKNRSLPTITLMFMQWGQFLDHDITLTATSRAFNNTVPRCCLPGGTGFLPPEFMHPECMPIPVPHDDWFLGKFGIRCMEFIRSAPATRINCDLGWREQINQVTSYIDASMIYGSDVNRAESLRTFRNGQLQYGRRAQQSPTDPPDGEICQTGAISTSCFLGGDSRFGEQPGLTSLHTIWVRFHNKIAKGLQVLNPLWSDEKLYQESRRIIGALVQHITYREFLPIVLGQEVMELFELKLLNKEYYAGYDKRVDPATANAFATAAFRFGHSLVQNSFVRSTINHLHMMNNVSIHHEQENPENIWSPGSLDRLILGLCNQPSQMRDEFIGRELTNHLFQSDNVPFGMDLAAINIQRGRDHGIPSYTSWRHPCGLTPINDWQDLAKVMRSDTMKLFQSIYEDIDDIDLYSGGLAEKPVRGGMVGPVFACIIAQQFLNYRKGDRFWYENGNLQSTFTPAQLQQIRKVNFAHVICHTIEEIHNIQPFVFLMSDNDKNSRFSCDSLLKNSLDLTSWAEEGFNSIDFNENFNGFEATHSKNDFLNTLERENIDFDFDKAFQHTVEVTNQINNEDLVIDDKLDVIDVENLNNEDLPKIFLKRHANETSTKSNIKKFVQNNLILMRNLKNIKINDHIETELKKSANISSQITVLPKENHQLIRKVVNDTILLVNPDFKASIKPTLKNSSCENCQEFISNDKHNNTKNSSKVFSRSNIGSKRKQIESSEHSSFTPYIFQRKNSPKLSIKGEEIKSTALNGLDNGTDTDGQTRDVTKQELRHIDDYILDALGDYYYDYDDDTNTSKKQNKKRRKRPTSRPSKPSKTTFNNGPNKLNKIVTAQEGLYLANENEKEPDSDQDAVHDETQIFYSQFPSDTDKVHGEDFFVRDPALTDGDTKNDFPNYHVNINIHYVFPNTKPIQDNDFSTRRPQVTDKDHSFLENNGHTGFANKKPILLNLYDGQSDVNRQKPFKESMTKRPWTASTTSYPIYVLSQSSRIKPDDKLTYVTNYLADTTTKATKLHDVPIYISKRPINKPANQETFDINYSPVYNDLTTKAPHRPILILKPYDTDDVNTQDDYNVPVYQKLPLRPSYSTTKPQTTRRTTRRPQIIKPVFPSYLYTSDDTHDTNPKRPNKDPIIDDDRLYENFATVYNVKNPTKLTSTSNNFNKGHYNVDDKLDFKTNLLPHRLKLSSDKNYVKISSIKVDYTQSKGNKMENKEGGEDFIEKEAIMLPELEGTKVVQIDVLPSDNRYKYVMFNDTEDASTMPSIWELRSETDCATEFPKPIANKLKPTPAAA